ncbi:hypothetical protein ColLi_08446 [Colletotrichum liriopes]|uniref:Uncharacterized protein n=1 Tax=Colletotrichum liriopes TaxID=708192 RepID=A0AA37GQY8_9PEZI|nr:hypothetical protein ColLi_08446 [Colletotrichum liriopes]
MRASTLAVAVASVVALLSSIKGAAADENAGKPRKRGKLQRVTASINFKNGARSPRDLNDFVSYDYGYSYPAPPSPTTYAEESSSLSTMTSLVSSNNASYTEVSSVASITVTSGVSDSASFRSTVSARASTTLSDTVITSTSAPVTGSSTSVNLLAARQHFVFGFKFDYQSTCWKRYAHVFVDTERRVEASVPRTVEQFHFHGDFV